MVVGPLGCRQTLTLQLGLRKEAAGLHGVLHKQEKKKKRRGGKSTKIEDMDGKVA